MRKITYFWIMETILSSDGKKMTRAQKSLQAVKDGRICKFNTREEMFKSLEI